MAIVNKVLKAIFAGLGAGIGVLVGATAGTSTSWGDISVNTWLTALGAAIAMFATVYARVEGPRGPRVVCTLVEKEMQPRVGELIAIHYLQAPARVTRPRLAGAPRRDGHEAAGGRAQACELRT